MLRIWKYFLFFFACLVFALLFNLPLQNVLPHVKLPDTIRVAGVDGTLIKGSATEVTIDDFPIRALDYRYMPSCIPLLKICYRIRYNRGDLQVAYDLLQGDTEVARTYINYEAAELMAHLPNALVQPVGQLELVIDELSLIDGKPDTLNGSLIWHNFGLDDDGIKINIGDYRLDFTGNPRQYEFKLSDLDASLEVDGEGEVRADGRYDVNIRITSETRIDSQVKYVLDLVARNTGYNKYRFEQQGRLPPNITRQLF